MTVITYTSDSKEKSRVTRMSYTYKRVFLYKNINLRRKEKKRRYRTTSKSYI
jgi:hypothetical protein